MSSHFLVLDFDQGQVTTPFLLSLRGVIDWVAMMICTRQAFLRGRFSEQPTPALLIGDRCLSRIGTVCRVCEEFCDVDAIRFRLLAGGRSEPSVDLERCTLCSACADACPVGAITIAAAALTEVAP